MLNEFLPPKSDFCKCIVDVRVNGILHGKRDSADVIRFTNQRDFKGRKMALVAS